jgi:hypothetical protein
MRLRLTLVGLLTMVPGISSSSGTPAVTVRLDSYQAGRSPAHHLTFAARAGDPELVRVSVIYPDTFRFTSFLAVAGVDTPVGRYALDFNSDGVPERQFPLIAATPEIAYVDLMADGDFDPAVDPHVRYSTGAGFELSLPFGGDADPKTSVVPFDVRVTVTLVAGLLVNPTLGGRHVVRASVETVDPESGDIDDGQGAPPAFSAFEVPLTIAGPTIVPFARLWLDAIDCRHDRRDRFSLALLGRYIPGRGSSIDLRKDAVTVLIDWVDPARPPRRAFSQTIQGGAFRRAGLLHHFEGAPPGIDDFWLGPLGLFYIDVRDLTLVDPGRTMAVTLAIGNDQGTTMVTVSHPHGKR